ARQVESFALSTDPAREQLPAAPTDLSTVGGAVDESTPSQRQDIPDAESRCEALLAQDPANPSALHELSVLRLRRGAFAEAVPLLERLIERRPDFSDAYNNLGVALERLKRPAEAARQFEKTIELEPNRPEAHYNLGPARQSLGRRAQARARYDLA